MAVALTYDGLVADVQAYTKRSNEAFVASIPLFIMLAQQRMARDLKVSGVKVTLNDTMFNNNYALAKGAGWLNTSSMWIKVPSTDGEPADMWLPLLKASIDFCMLYWPETGNVQRPKYYEDESSYDNFLFFPTPDVDYSIRYIMYRLPNLIDPTVQTNFFTQFAPDILLAATMINADQFLQNTNEQQKWETKYSQAVAGLSGENLLRIQTGFTRREL